MKKFYRAIGRYILYFCRWLIYRMPYPLFRFSSLGFIGIAYLIMINKSQSTLESLSIAFEGEKTLSERKQIARKYFRNFARGMVDLIYFLDHEKFLKENIAIEGREHLDAALAKGNGVVILSAHFGIFISMYLRLIQEGYKTNVIMRRTRDSTFENYISDFRNQRGIRTIYAQPRRKCVNQALKALRSNELLIILLDQNYGGEGGVFVDFFGKKAATAAGPVVFSSRTDAPILPIFILREKGPRHKIIIEPPVELVKGDDQESLVENVSRLTQVVERYVREHPHECGGWMHKRWKTEYKGQPISKAKRS